MKKRAKYRAVLPNLCPGNHKCSQKYTIYQHILLKVCLGKNYGLPKLSNFFKFLVAAQKINLENTMF